ncbi:hypothetical protein GGQ74_001144 [Desulfobaculum xiamenense]|uniref:DUF6651 domain-containing protein n=1 Tax=Desulfobaculum xiamenense TaxID=995050 RepID=A0A846QQL9_9BACT|nr:DUF6651 domain-containing protein [Desulfobaculum xiamenense]NJB67504.1 hypothetical protein [Desulfobaculum xiamenense]
MPWKMDGDRIATQDGKPIWVYGDGKESPFDADAALSKIESLNSESATRKRELRKSQETLALLDGIDDIAGFVPAARKAMETVKNLDAKKLIDAGEAEKVKAEVARSMQAKIDELAGQLKQKETALVSEMIGGSFARSKFIAERLAIPHDLVEARFGKSFKIDGGRVVAVDASGNTLYSREKPGEPAGFDEALEMLVDSYPYKDTILKGSGGAGSGARPSGGAHSGGTINRHDMDAFGAHLEDIASGKVRAV